VFSAQIFQENTFLETRLNFSLTEKCFSLTNFSNGKQTQESLESDFPKSEFQETNIVIICVWFSGFYMMMGRGVCEYFNNCFLFKNILKKLI
jgi:hypothetical protein